MNNLTKRLLTFRSVKFHTTGQRFEGKDVTPKSTPEVTPKVDVDIGKSYMKPNGLDKFILVWGKKFKSQAEVPNLVTSSMYNHARNVVRIKLANYTIVLVLLGCVYQVYTGKQEAKKGNTLLKRSLDWHEELKKEHEKEVAEKAALEATGK
uniref:UPF0389 protein CG9231 n=1 Tax=Cacopsylla melanoneura TaxID=428564 RepID=A0A8D8RB21_9HEMI